MSGDFLDRLHDRCLRMIKAAKAKGDTVEVWRLISLGLRILKAKNQLS